MNIQDWFPLGLIGLISLQSKWLSRVFSSTKIWKLTLSFLYGLTLCNFMDHSLPGSSVHGVLQARILEWVAILFSKGCSQPRYQTESPAWQADSLPLSHQGSPSLYLARTLYILEPLWNLSSKVYTPKEGKKETCSPWSWQEPLKVSKEDVKTQGWIKTKAFLLKVYRYIFL